MHCTLLIAPSDSPFVRTYPVTHKAAGICVLLGEKKGGANGKKDYHITTLLRLPTTAPDLHRAPPEVGATLTWVFIYSLGAVAWYSGLALEQTCLKPSVLGHFNRP